MKRITIDWLAGMVAEALLARGVETTREQEAADIADWFAQRDAEAEKRGAVKALRRSADALLPPVNCELRPDGSEDPEVARWVGFVHDVWTEINARADRIEREGDRDA